MTTSARFDQATAGAFLSRELEHVLPRVFEKKYPDIVYSSILPVSNEVPEGAETYKYEVTDHIGDFDLVADYADDLPTSDVLRGEVRNNIRNYAGSFRYSMEELRKAAFANIPLNQRKANATRDAYERLCNRIALFGQAGTGLRGFFNHPLVDNLVVTGTASDGWFDAASITPAGMQKILNEGVTHQVQNTKMIERPDTLLMPYSAYRIVSTTQNSTASDTTVLEYFLRTNEYIKEVKPINELDPANSGGRLSQPRMVYYRRDPDLLQFHMAMALKFHEPQPRNLSFLVPAEAKIAGVALYYPKGVTYVTKG
jgi:hypothetical protein